MRSAYTRDDSAATGMLTMNFPSHTYRARDSKPDSASATTAAFEDHGIVAINQKRPERTSPNDVGAGYFRSQIIRGYPRQSEPLRNAYSCCLCCCFFTSRSPSADEPRKSNMPPLLDDAGVRLALEGRSAISVDAWKSSARSIMGVGRTELKLLTPRERPWGSPLNMVSGTEAVLAQTTLS